MFKRSVALTREGWYFTTVLALVFAGAVLREVNLLMLLAGMLSGLLVLGAVFTLLGLRGLEVVRRLPAEAGAGEPIRVELVLKSRRRRRAAWGITVEDRFDESARRLVARATAFFPRVAAGQTRRAFYEIRLPRRGRYRVGPLRLGTRFPLGLVRHALRIGQQSSLLVTPRLGRLTRAWRLLEEEDLLARQHGGHRRGLLEGDFYALRPWRAGDSRRWVHWRSTARQGTLVVRQFERPRGGDLAVLLDLWQPSHAAPQDQEHVELAVRFAATVLAAACNSGGRRAELLIAGRSIDRAEGWASRHLLGEMMETLALCEPHSERKLHPSIIERAARVRPDQTVILVTTRGSVVADFCASAGAEATGAVRCLDASSEQISRYFEDVSSRS